MTTTPAFAKTAVMRQMIYGTYLDEVWTVDARRDGSGGAVSVSMLNDGTLGAGGESHRVFCHANTLYHVRGVTDETGALREAFQYTPYGVHTRIADGPDADSVINFGADDVRTAGARSAFGVSASFTGQRFDPETGLHYYKNRYYSARLGRFVSRDALLLQVDPNWYVYGGDNPLMFGDPYGLEDNCTSGTCTVGPPSIAPAPTPFPPLSKEQCEAYRNEFLNESKAMKYREQFQKSNCPFPPSNCDKCPCADNLGSYSSDTKNITLCYGGNTSSSKHKTRETFYHELQHALDDCQGRLSKEDCGKRACSEIRSTIASGECSLYVNEESRKECIKKSVVASLNGGPCQDRGDALFQAAYAKEECRQVP